MPAPPEGSEVRARPRVLVVDNYDSFVYNLVQYLAQLGAVCVVRRNDAVGVEELDGLGVDAVLVSPGPGVPERAGVSVAMVAACGERRLPVLGVCLGHQAIAVAYGGLVERAPELLHGKTSAIEHDGAGLFVDLPSPFTATRYHSLAVVESSLPPDLEVTARTSSGVVMGIRHRGLPMWGVQFHPESVLTDGGHVMLARWLAAAALPVDLAAARRLSAGLAERLAADARPFSGARARGTSTATG
ncbi:MAG: aminodeoxychorismate/anthranilate synthase component II [Pseudonocardiales bacterium]|nr:MAG: aminodeoxychorismate/anthranilate synthase component II [Pseudonocardiales bacterium]